MSTKGDRTAAVSKPKRLTVKKQTLRDLSLRTDKDVKGGVSRGAAAEGDSRYCVAAC